MELSVTASLTKISAPKQATPSAEGGKAGRAGPRGERGKPKWPIRETDTAVSNRAELRKGTAKSICIMSATGIGASAREIPQTEAGKPRRDKLCSGSSEPEVLKPETNAARPARAKERHDGAGPVCAKPMMGTTGPTQAQDRNDREDPGVGTSTAGGTNPEHDSPATGAEAARQARLRSGGDRPGRVKLDTNTAEPTQEGLLIDTGKPTCALSTANNSSSSQLTPGTSAAKPAQQEFLESKTEPA